MQDNIDTGGQVAEADVPVTDAAEVKSEAVENEVSTDDGDDAPASDVDSELKTVRKALDKRNRYINNQRNRIRDLESQMQKLRDGFGSNKTAAPELEKFDSVIDYMKADNNYTLEQKLAEQAHKNELSQLEQQQNMALQQQVHEVSIQMQELLSSNTDFQKVISSNANVIESMPPFIEKMMVEIDDAPAATYALAKEGRLQALYSMPPHIAAAHLVQAEIRGQQYLQQAAPNRQVNQTQPAPKPIGSLKGSGKSNKSYADMNADELAKRFLK